MTDATIHQLRPPAPVSRGCLVREDDGRCPREARWSLTLRCTACLLSGSGPACDYHTEQAREHGVPHRGCDQMADVVSAIPLGAR